MILVTNLVILTGFNLDVNERFAHLIEKGEMPHYSPGTDYSVIKCPRCDAEMWVGPKQQATAKRLGDGAVFRCLLCTFQEAADQGVSQLRAFPLGPDSPRRHPS